jgi:hypothetical protein
MAAGNNDLFKDQRIFFHALGTLQQSASQLILRIVILIFKTSHKSTLKIQIFLVCQKCLLRKTFQKMTLKKGTFGAKNYL